MKPGFFSTHSNQEQEKTSLLAQPCPEPNETSDIDAGRFQGALTYAIRSVDANLVQEVLNTPSGEPPITFEQMKAVYDLDRARYSPNMPRTELKETQIEIFNLIKERHQFSQAELDAGLHFITSAHYISETIFNQLIELGASPNYIEYDRLLRKKSSALMNVCLRGIGCERYPETCRQSDKIQFIHMAQQLLNHGADSNLRFDQDNTLLHYLVQEICGKGHLYPLPENFSSTILKNLIQHGADPTLKNTSEETCLDLAYTGKNTLTKCFEQYASNQSSCDRFCVIL